MIAALWPHARQRERERERERGGGGAGHKNSDWLGIDVLYFPSETCLRLLPVFPLSPFSVSFFLLSFPFDLSIYLKCYLMFSPPSVPMHAVSLVGTSRLALHQGKHAALMTTCVTLHWCHHNSAPPLKLERLGTLTTQQHPPHPPPHPSLSSSVVTSSKTMCSPRLPKQSIFPSDTCVV